MRSRGLAVGQPAALPADMHALVVKHGALGDVVRTSYFAEALRHEHGERLRLSWLTAPASSPLLRFNPHIDDIWTSFEEARGFRFDRVFSLDDEAAVIDGVMSLDAAALTGASRDGSGRPAYSDDAAEWFDMGLLSRFGKERADQLKKLNQAGHAEIFARIFAVPVARPGFFGHPRFEQWAFRWLPAGPVYVGINSFAGGRWPAKELPAQEIPRLIDGLLALAMPGRNVVVVLIGAGTDLAKNRDVAEKYGSESVLVTETDDAVLRLAGVIGRLDCLVTSDSLAMHLAIAQRVPTVAFFAPTSAAEIDDFGLLSKLVSTSPDYCSYRKDADNSSITAARLLPLIASKITARASQ